MSTVMAVGTLSFLATGAVALGVLAWAVLSQLQLRADPALSSHQQHDRRVQREMWDELFGDWPAGR